MGTPKKVPLPGPIGDRIKSEVDSEKAPLGRNAAVIRRAVEEIWNQGRLRGGRFPVR